MRLQLQTFGTPLGILFMNPADMILRNLPLLIPGHTCQCWPSIYSIPLLSQCLLDLDQPLHLFSTLISLWPNLFQTQLGREFIRKNHECPTLSVTDVYIGPWVILWFVGHFLRYDILIFLVLMMSFNSVPQAIWTEMIPRLAAAW